MSDLVCLEPVRARFGQPLSPKARAGKTPSSLAFARIKTFQWRLTEGLTHQTTILGKVMIVCFGGCCTDLETKTALFVPAAFVKNVGNCQDGELNAKLVMNLFVLPMTFGA